MLSFMCKGADNVVYLHLQEEEMVWEASRQTSATFFRLCLGLTFSVSIPSFLSFTKTRHWKVIIQIFFLWLSFLYEGTPDAASASTNYIQRLLTRQAWGREMTIHIRLFNTDTDTIVCVWDDKSEAQALTQHTREAVCGASFPICSRDGLNHTTNWADAFTRKHFVIFFGTQLFS